MQQELQLYIKDGKVQFADSEVETPKERVTETRFIEIMEGLLEDAMEGQGAVSFRERLENNRKGISCTIRKNGNSSGVCFKMHLLYHRYCKGESIADLVNEMKEIALQKIPSEALAVADEITLYEKARHHLGFRLIGRNNNEELLESLPHLIRYDLALEFVYFIKPGQPEEGTVTLNKKIVDGWNIDMETLTRDAMENAQKTLVPVIAPINEQMFFNEEHTPFVPVMALDHLPKISELYAVTNQSRNLGAACLFYPEVQEKLSDLMQGGYYILPSSIHEVIILSDQRGPEPEDMLAMIKEVNENIVEPEEVLSNSLYHFNPETQNLELYQGKTS